MASKGDFYIQDTNYGIFSNVTEDTIILWKAWGSKNVDNKEFYEHIESKVLIVIENNSIIWVSPWGDIPQTVLGKHII